MAPILAWFQQLPPIRLSYYRERSVIFSTSSNYIEQPYDAEWGLYSFGRVDGDEGEWFADAIALDSYSVGAPVVW